MDNLKKLASHFNNYWYTKGEHMDINLAATKPTRSAAEDPVAPKAPAPAAPAPAPKVTTPATPKMPPAPPAKKEPEDIAESVGDIDELVEKEIGRKVVLTLKRIVEDAIRKTFGKTFQEMERTLRPEIEQEVANQAKDVEKEIKEILPQKAVEKTVEEKTAPAPAAPVLKAPKAPAAPAPAAPAVPAAPAAPAIPAAPKAASLEKSAADIISDLPKAITLSDGTVIQPLDAQRAKVMKDGKDLGVEMGLNPDLKEEDQVKLYEQKLLDLRKAVAPLEIKQGPIPNITPTAPTVAPAADAAPEASAQLITESSKEVTSMFRVSYHSGNTIEDSYFVGSDGTNIKVVSAARVIPADLQEQIAKAEAENKEIQDLIAPEEAEKQIADAVGNSMEGFTEWAKQLPKITRSASLKKSAEWAINESEIPKVEMPKKGTVIDSVCPEEKKQGLALTEVPKGTKSPIKKFYGRLPGEGGGEVTQGLNLQSQISKTYQLMKQALEEKEQEVETLKSEKGKVEKEFGDFKEKDDINKTKGLVDNVLAELKKLKPVAPEKEKDIVDILSKVGSKGLGQLMEIINIVSAKEDKVGADLFGGPAAPKGPAGMPPLPPKPASQRVVGGVDLPATYPSNDSYSLTEVVTGIFESTNK